MSEEQILKFFYDSACVEEIKLLNFGEVELGDAKELSIFVKNVSSHRVEVLDFSIDVPYVMVLEFPKELKSKEIGNVRLKWKVDPSLKKKMEGKLSYKVKEVFE